jgi:thiamine biosynthesis lipoprotein
LLTTSEREFRAMGTDCHIIVVAEAGSGDDLGQLAVDRVELLENCWSRFRPTSELNRLNASAGREPVVVSDDLLLLVSRMREAWQLSGGLFDPTVLPSVNALGYDTDFATVVARPSAETLDDVANSAAPGMSGVRIDEAAHTVWLPSRVGIDPGAIGKGLAADVVATELYAAGAEGVLVNLGGDLAFIGCTQDGSGWSIGVEDERLPAGDPNRVMRQFEFPQGPTTAGVATSTTLKRRWAQGRRHHVIDPRTGQMSSSDLVQVTIVAEVAWQAEALATTALLLPSDEAAHWLRERELTAILLTADGSTVTTDEGVLHG